MARASVVLPEPDSPTTATVSPLEIVNRAALTTWRSPNRTARSRTVNRLSPTLVSAPEPAPGRASAPGATSVPRPAFTSPPDFAAARGFAAGSSFAPAPDPAPTPNSAPAPDPAPA